MIVERDRERERQKEREEREKVRESGKKRQRLCRSTQATTRIARDLRESHEGDSYSIIDREKDRERETEILIYTDTHIYGERMSQKEKAREGLR